MHSAFLTASDSQPRRYYLAAFDHLQPLIQHDIPYRRDLSCNKHTRIVKAEFICGNLFIMPHICAHSASVYRVEPFIRENTAIKMIHWC